MKTIENNTINKYLLFLKENEMSSATIEKYNRDLLCFCRFADGRTIDKPLCLEYKEYLKENYSVNSANSMVASLNSFLKYIGKIECCVSNSRSKGKSFVTKKANSQRTIIKSLCVPQTERAPKDSA